MRIPAFITLERFVGAVSLCEDAVTILVMLRMGRDKRYSAV